MSDLLLSDKYKHFLKHDSPVEFLEGTTMAGKTTVGILKFMLKVAASDKKLHVLSGLDLGTIEKNIINKDLGISDIFGELIEYNSSGRGEHSLPHILYNTKNGIKIIYVLGYDNKARWKKILGGQYGCVYIDEINVADMEYVREISMRCDYFLATLNPDNPNLDIYKEYINKSRPLPKYITDGPKELIDMLNEPQNEGWTWWFFSFNHNLGLSEERIKKAITNVPTGTKIYKNKILGLRGKSTGLVFFNFDRKKHCCSRDYAKTLLKGKTEKFILFSSGLDTSYSSKSPDTVAMSFIGITNKGRIFLLAERDLNNRNMNIPFAPSDIAKLYVEFLEQNRTEWGFAKTAYVDSADQATITELNKYRKTIGCMYSFVNAWKKMGILDRINHQIGWLQHNDMIIVDTCTSFINELEIYSWNETKDFPEDGNDHMINSVQYSFIPYVDKLGIQERN